MIITKDKIIQSSLPKKKAQSIFQSYQCLCVENRKFFVTLQTCNVRMANIIKQMISKTYYRYIWLLDTLLNSSPLTIDEINMLWEDCPLSNGPIPLRTFHEQRKGIKEMFGVEIVCDRSHGNVYYVKNPEVLDEQKVAKWLLHKYSIPQDFATFNSMKDRILLEEIPLGTSFLDDIIEAMQKNTELRIDYQRYEGEQGEEHLQTFHIQPYALKVFNRRWYLLGFIKEKDGLRTIALDRILAPHTCTESAYEKFHLA